MSMEFEKLAYLGDPMQAMSRGQKCGAIPHASGESCLWRPSVSVDLMEADSNDEKELKLWCDPDHGYATKEGCLTERKSRNLKYAMGVRLT
jgi:hypothetical protein